MSEVRGEGLRINYGVEGGRFCDGDTVRYGAVASSSGSLVSYYIPVLMPAGSNMFNSNVSSHGIVEDNCVKYIARRSSISFSKIREVHEIMICVRSIVLSWHPRPHARWFQHV